MPTAHTSLPYLDLVVLLGYLAGVVGLGCWFVRSSRGTEAFMAADRSLPGWAVGLSIFGTYVSSISFLANPGKAYAGNWNSFVFGLSLPLAAWIAVRYFVPFYRDGGVISAYEHLETRFGVWARTYAVA
ncbi:MAG: sodium:solute symporter, partial [Pirellulaceae bacterium]|nr:sodium:solute symporter [Pirellulaceae bacterium]